MKIIVEFENEDEFEAFRTSGKKTRKGRGEKDDTPETGAAGTAGVPPLQQPPTSNPAAAPQGFGGFAPPAGGAGPGPGFGAPAAPAAGPNPQIAALVQRIVTRLDAAIASGQNTDAALAWFRTECGPNAAQATFEQIKGHHLFQLDIAKLEHIAKVMAA